MPRQTRTAPAHPLIHGCYVEEEHCSYYYGRYQPYRAAECQLGKTTMRKTRLFHGGELESADFGGKTFWTSSIERACEYGYSNDKRHVVYILLVNDSKERFFDENDDLYTEDMDNEERWEEQTRQIEVAFKNGATVFCAEDGWALDHRGRKVRRLSPALTQKMISHDRQ